MDVQNEFTHDKAEIRRRLLTRRSSAADKPVLSRRAVARLLPLLRGNVMIYVSIGSELDTSGLIDVLLGNSDIALFAPYTSKGAIVPLPVKSAERRIVSAICRATVMRTGLMRLKPPP